MCHVRDEYPELMLTALQIIALQNYQSILYRSLGVGPKVTLVLVGTWSTVVTIDHVFGAMFFDKWGRRKNFFFCMVFIIIGSVLLVAFWAQFEAGGETNKTLGSLAVWSMYVFVIGYAWNMNSFGYAYAPEILVSCRNDTGRGSC